MSGYAFRNTPSRKLAREMMELKARKPPMISRLTRANTGLRNIYLKSKETGSTRDEIEEAGVLEQCESVILPPVPGKSICWLCGFPIEGIGLPEAVSNLYWSQYLDSAVCEHVLPVRLAGVITGLYYPYGGLTTVGDEHLLHSVYEYSHHLCNLAKSDEWFLSKPNKLSPSYCDLVVNPEKINRFLEYLFQYTVSPIGRYPVTFVERDGVMESLSVDRHESGIFTIQDNKGRRVFENNVQYYVYRTFRNDEGDTDLERMKNEWKAEQFSIIEEKTKSLIRKIKDADGCSGERSGALYSASMTALTELEQKGRVERLPGPSRPIFARSPSINNIARSMRASRTQLPRGVTAGNIAGMLGIKPTGRDLLRTTRTHRRKKRSTRGTKRRKGSRFNKLKKLFLK